MLSDQELNLEERKAIEDQFALISGIDFYNPIIPTNYKKELSMETISVNVTNIARAHQEIKSPEHVQLLLDYKSLLQSYNTLSEAFHSHVLMSESSCFINKIKELKLENQKSKQESQYYLEKLQNLIAEIQSPSSNSKTRPNCLTKESIYNILFQNSSQSLKEELQSCKETISKQTDDIQFLKSRITQMTGIESQYQDQLTNYAKLNQTLQALSDKNKAFKQEIEDLYQQKSKQEQYIQTLCIHRELLIKENKYLNGNIKEAELFASKPLPDNNNEELYKIRLESLEQQRVLVEEKIKVEQQLEDCKKKCEEYAERLRLSQKDFSDFEAQLENYEKNIQSLENEKKNLQENIENLKKTLDGTINELEYLKKKSEIPSPYILQKLVGLIHKSSKAF